MAVRRHARIRYEVFLSEGAPEEPGTEAMRRVCSPHVSWRRVLRKEENEVFRAPRYLAPGGRDPQRRPVELPESHPVRQGMARAKVCFVFTSEKVAGDHLPLQAAMALAAASAAPERGVVVDRTAGLAYESPVFMAMQDRFNSDGAHDARDAVVVAESAGEGVVTLRTRGLVKYGQQEIVFEAFPAGHVELARRLLYDNMCRHAIERRPIPPGETLPYTTADPTAQFYFAENDAGELLVRDRDPARDAPLEGLSRFLAYALA